jgi:diguanylate cyclase (GGDEF)-like protein
MENRQKRIDKRFKQLSTLFFVLALLMVSIVFVREYILLKQNAAFFNEQVLEDAKEDIKIEVDARVDEIDSVKDLIFNELLLDLEKRVIDMNLAADFSVTQLPITATLEEKQDMYIDMAYQFNLESEGSKFFILDQDGVLHLSGLRKDLEESSVLNTQDEVTGVYFFQEMINTVLNSETHDGFISYYWIKEIGGEPILKTSYVYYNESLDLILGTGVYDVDYIEDVKTELFTRISSYEYDSEDYIYIIGYDDEVIYHVNDSFSSSDLIAIKTLDGESFHETVIDTLQDEDFLFINYYFEFDDLNHEKIGYVRRIEDWDMYIGRSFVVDDLIFEQNSYIEKLLPGFILYNLIILLIVIGIVALIKKNLSNSINDIKDEFDEQNKIIKKISFKDQLTGLYNRTYFEDVKANYEPCTEYVGVIMVDVDGLKLLNDAFGHSVGDKVLKSVATILRNTCSSEDVFRWGGDEFVAIISKTTIKDLEAYEKIFIKEIKKIKINQIKISASIGYSLSQSCSDSIYEIIKYAEKMMYDHKLLASHSIKRTIIDGLLNTLYDQYNFEKGHADNVMKYALMIGESLHLSVEGLEKLKITALLHDIGKIVIPGYLLTKVEKLTDEEFEEIKLHAEKGYRILSAYPELSEYATYVLFHHERWDGKGYPRGLSKEDIPLFSRIICIADSFDAMTQDRIYKKKISKADALKELVRCKGTQFDPNLVDIFLKLHKKPITK